MDKAEITRLQELAQHQDEYLALWQKNVSINLQISSNLSNNPAVRWFVVVWVFFLFWFHEGFLFGCWGGGGVLVWCGGGGGVVVLRTTEEMSS